MYAKLVMSSTPSTGNYNDFSRDIIRLITSASPSTSLLSSNTWNVAASAIFDTTPAGWTYVGSNLDVGSLSGVNTDGGTPSAATAYGWYAKAPCTGALSSKYKFIGMMSQKMTVYDTWVAGTLTKVNCCLTACTNATSSGVVTNEAFRQTSNGSSVYTFNTYANNNWGFAGTGTYHLIANERHVTLIKESSNIQALWEHSASDPHIYYGNAPMVYYSWNYSTAAGTPAWATGTGATSSPDSPNYDGAWVMNLTDTSTGTNYGSRPVNSSGSNNYYSDGANQPYFWPHLTKVATSNSTGLARHLVSPIMFNLFHHGYPTMYVTGTVPAYLMKGGTGTTGDSININGTIYTYFNVNSVMGLAMLTS